MPVVGTRKNNSMGNGYSYDGIHGLAEAFRATASDILNEGVDLFTDPMKAIQVRSTRNALKNFFTENAFDADEFTKVDPGHAAQLMEDAQTSVEELFQNDVEGLMEHAVVGSMNPVMGMTFPLHKNLMMNNVFDKGAIPKFVAREPKFTISMEKRILTTPDGQEIDMFKEQYKMREAIDSAAPFVEVEMKLPETGATDVLGALHATTDDALSIETHISAVKVSGVYLEAGDINPETGAPVEAAGEVSFWMPVKLDFVPNYGDIDRVIAEEVVLKGKKLVDDTVVPYEYKDVITGFVRKNAFVINSTSGLVSDVKLNARLDTSSAAVRTCSVSWKVRTDIVEIPSAIPINTTVSPEEVKDIGALYNTNQLAKIMSLMKTALGEYKDATIKNKLDISFQNMPAENKFATTFDFAPRAGYALDHVEWRRKTFMDYLDSVVTGLLQVLNDPNMTVSVFGAPDLIRKVTPTEYTYQTPSNIGPVELDFVKTVVTSDKRVYQFIGSDKMRGNPNLIIILCPRNSDRIVYRIYDYQMYVSNEIRNTANPALPAIHGFDRWKFVEYQPVQGRIKVLNPTGLNAIAPNTDPIGTSYASDFALLR